MPRGARARVRFRGRRVGYKCWQG